MKKFWLKITLFLFSLGLTSNLFAASSIVYDQASDIEVIDSGSYFSGSNVEAVLQEIGNDLASIDFTPYAKLDGSNQPFIGNLEISKTAPEYRLTDEGGEYSRLIRTSSSNSLKLKNRIELPASAGEALSFDGASSVSASDTGLLSGASTRSISLWINITVQSGEYSAPFSYGTQGSDQLFEILTNSSGNVFFHRWGTVSQFTGVVASTGVWYHVVLTYDGTTLKGYWNGVEKVSEVCALNTTLSGALYFGRSASGSPRYFNGLVDEPTIWNRALSQAEVTTLYNSGAGMFGDVLVAPYDSGVISGWHLDEGTGTSAADFIGSRTITLGGATSWVEGFISSGTGTMVEVDVISSDNNYTTVGNPSVPTKIASFSSAGVVQSNANGVTSVNNTLTDITLAGTTYADNGLLTLLPNASNSSNYIDIYPSATSGANNWSGIYCETYGSAKWIGIYADETGVFLSASESINIDQDTTIDGDISADNLSGTNTGDQDLGILPITTITASSLSPDSTYYTILCDTTSNAITINLPAASTNEGRIYVFKVIDATNDVTIDANSSEKIDDSATIILTELYESITIQCDGSNWWIIN